MTGRSPLERKYRRWLRFYPTSFRAQHEEEMITVLIHGSGGEHRPRTGELIDLAQHGLRERLRQLAARIPSRWERDHARAMFPIRVGIALWLCLISGLLIGYHRGELWLVLLLPAIAAHLYIAYCIRPGAGRRVA